MVLQFTGMSMEMSFEGIVWEYSAEGVLVLELEEIAEQVLPLAMTDDLEIFMGTL